MLSIPILLLMLFPVIRKIVPRPKNSHHSNLSGVTIPRKIITLPTMYITCGIPNSCLTRTPEKSASLEPFVTRIPVERDITSEGI